MLDSYIEDFRKLNVDRSSGHAKPHKVCMLYAVMDLIAEGEIKTNKIFYDDKLLERFNYYFEKLRSRNDQCNPYLPYYHLNSASFWHLKFHEGPSTFNKRSVNERAIKQWVEYAYLDEALFSLLQQAEYSQQLRDELGNNFSGLSEQFVRWAKEIGKSEKTAQNYLGALERSIPKWSREDGLPMMSLLDFRSLKQYKTVVEQIKQQRIFQERNLKGKNMYSCALKAYEDFLADTTQVQLQEDIDAILQDQSCSDTEKSTLVKARIGQGKYRQELVDLWQRCSLTGFENRDFLIASHIKPWRSAQPNERLDKYNGLLLVANVDKAFDKAYITFEDDGTMLISEELEEYTKLGIGLKTKLSMHQQNREYMAYHREELFRG